MEGDGLSFPRVFISKVCCFFPAGSVVIRADGFSLLCFFSVSQPAPGRWCCWKLLGVMLLKQRGGGRLDMGRRW